MTERWPGPISGRVVCPGLRGRAKLLKGLELLADLGEAPVGRDGLDRGLLGLLPGGLGLLGLLKLEIDVTQVFVDGRVTPIGEVLDRLLQWFDALP